MRNVHFAGSEDAPPELLGLAVGAAVVLLLLLLVVVVGDAPVVFCATAAGTGPRASSTTISATKGSCGPASSRPAPSGPHV